MIYRYYDPASVSVHALCWSIPDRQSGVLLQCCQSVPALRRSVPGYGVARAHVPFPTSVWTVTWSASAQTPSAFPRQDTGSFATVSILTTFLPCRRGQEMTRSASICDVFVSASCPSLDALEPHHHVTGVLRILVYDAVLLIDPHTLPRALQRPRHIPRLEFC